MKKVNENVLSAMEILDKKKFKIQKRRSLRSMLLELVFTVVVLFILVFVIFGFASVDGNSMYPALRDGDLVMVFRLEKSFQASEVITFKLDDERYVKRVVAVAGDTVDIDDESGYLIVNGSVMNSDVLFPTTTLDSSVQFPYTVPDGCVFVLGDNREHSTDSRVFSAIPIDSIQGKVMLVLRTRII